MAIDSGTEDVLVVRISGKELEELDTFVLGRGTNRLEVICFALGTIYSNFADVVRKGEERRQ